MTPGDAPARGDTITRNTVFAFAAQMSTAAFTAALTIFLTRELGPAGFGTFSLALGVTGLLLRPAGGGTTQAAARYIAERHGDTRAIVGVLGMALRIRFLTATTIGAALFALAEPIASLYDAPELTGPLRGVALAFIGQNMFNFVRTVFVALRRAVVGFKVVVSEAAMEFAATVSFVLAGTGATGAAFGRASGYAFGLVLGLFALSRALGRSPLLGTGPSPVARREFAGYAGAMLIITVAGAVFARLDVLLIGAFLSTSAVGIYAAPLRLIGFLGYPGLAVAQGVAPRQARHPDQPARVAALGRALGYVLILQTGIVVFLIVWADPIVRLLLGSEFSESAEVLRALTPFILLNGLGPLLATSLNYAGEGKRRIPIAIATVVVAAALYVILIPENGVLGAAVGTDVGFALYFAGHLWLTHRAIGLPLRPLATTVLRSFAAGGAAAAALALVGTDSLSAAQWVIGILVGGATFVAVLLLTRELSTAEIRSLGRLAGRALRKG